MITVLLTKKKKKKSVIVRQEFDPNEHLCSVEYQNQLIICTLFLF